MCLVGHGIDSQSKFHNPLRSSTPQIQISSRQPLKDTLQPNIKIEFVIHIQYDACNLYDTFSQRHVRRLHVTGLKDASLEHGVTALFVSDLPQQSQVGWTLYQYCLQDRYSCRLRPFQARSCSCWYPEVNGLGHWQLHEKGLSFG